MSDWRLHCRRAQIRQCQWRDVMVHDRRINRLHSTLLTEFTREICNLNFYFGWKWAIKNLVSGGKATHLIIDVSTICRSQSIFLLSWKSNHSVWSHLKSVSVPRVAFHSDMQIFALILPILCCGIFSGSAFNISPKIFDVNGFGPCPDQNELLMQFNITEKALPQRNKYYMNGTILVLEKISGPIEVSENCFLHPNKILIHRLVIPSVTLSHTTLHLWYDRLRRFQYPSYTRDLHSFAC